jgi:hypothetical protein
MVESSSCACVPTYANMIPAGVEYPRVHVSNRLPWPRLTVQKSVAVHGALLSKICERLYWIGLEDGVMSDVLYILPPTSSACSRSESRVWRPA